MADQLTPFDLKLEKELSDEFRRMQNEWFFPWLGMGENGMSVDGFDGRTIQYGGIKFEGTPRLVYWSTVSRYLENKSQEIFETWKFGTANASWQTKLLSLDRTHAAAIGFAHRIISYAAETDRRLRGEGYPDRVPKADTGSERETIEARLSLLRAAFDTTIDRPSVGPRLGLLEKLDSSLGRYPNIWKAAQALGLGGLAFAALKWLFP